jgi:excisionase family DNA binding protein
MVENTAHESFVLPVTYGNSLNEGVKTRYKQVSLVLAILLDLPYILQILCFRLQRGSNSGAHMKSSTARTSEIREVMDIRQASDYLGISPDTLYKYASESFIPAFKLGNRWRFKKSRLDDWMDRQSDQHSGPSAVPEPAPKAVRPRQKKPVRGVRRAQAVKAS